MRLTPAVPKCRKGRTGLPKLVTSPHQIKVMEKDRKHLALWVQKHATAQSYFYIYIPKVDTW